MVDGYNFIIDETSNAIASGPSSCNVNGGTSYGYITINTESETELSVSCYTSSESYWDYGCVYVGTNIYEPSQTDIKDEITDGNGKYLFVGSGATSSSNSTTLEGGKTYYVSFAYAKDFSGNDGSDRLFITNISYQTVV